MRNTTMIIVLALIAALMLTACAEYSYEEKTIEATVIACEEGTFFPEENYLAQANICLAFDKPEAYAYYMALANKHGHYDYHITISYNGVEAVIVRLDQYENGSTISLNATLEYADGVLVRIDCE